MSPVQTGSVGFQYDATYKRLQQVTTVLNAQTGVPASNYSVGYTYRTDGQLQSVTTPVGLTQLGYDAAARLSTLTNGLSETTTWTYDGIGRIKSQTTIASGTILTTNTTYGSTGQATDTSNAPLYVSQISNTVGGAVVQNYARTYSYLGQLTQQSETGSVNATQQYGYDSRGRLTQSNVADQSATYSYDLSNNLQGASDWTYNSLNQVTSAPASPAAGLGGITSPGYDTAGHLTGASGMVLVWNVWGQLEQIQNVPSGSTTVTVSFVYDALGRRAAKLVNGTLVTRYLYNASSLVGETDASGTVTRQYTWGMQGLISDATTNAASSRFYQYDGSANVRALIGSSGQVLWQGAWTPWGTAASAGAPPTPFGWVGRDGGYTDTETGLVLLGARFYAPRIGRFISRDPSGFTNGANLYAYCMGDPINFYDSNGLWPEWSQEGYANGFDTFINFLRPRNQFDVLSRQLTHNPIDQVISLYDAWKDWGDQEGLNDAGKANPLELWLARGNAGLQTGLAAFSIAEGLGCNGLKITRTCFAGGTKVQVAAKVASNGKPIATTWKPIEKMRSGDLIPVRDLKSGKPVWRRVKETFKRTSDHLIVIALADKSGRVVESVKTTRQHPFFVSGKGFVPAGGLAVGNAIVTRAGPALRVRSIKWQCRSEGYTVYNFEVEASSESEDTHNYFVGRTSGGVLVHNANQYTPTNYPNPDPPMSEPPVRYQPTTVGEVERMRMGQTPLDPQTAGPSSIEAHHRQQVPTESGGILDELTRRTHRMDGNHTRHRLPSRLTKSQRSREIRAHYTARGSEYLLPGEGI